MSHKKVAIMQPYFFPYLGYFALINEVDEFILFDTPQFMRHSFIERNQILKQNAEKLYIKVPLKKHPRDTSINEVYINYDLDWATKILAQIQFYKKKAPHYQKVRKLLENCFKPEYDSITALNKACILACNEYIGIDTTVSIWSKMDLEIGAVSAPDEWALEICKKLSYKIYYNAIGGVEFFDRDKYHEAGIEIKFLKLHSTAYQQIGDTFVPNLSILDVMMFNSPSEIRRMLKNFELVQ